jgi:ABC-type branched-subunit amino acid transport system substrate-binding protein
VRTRKKKASLACLAIATLSLAACSSSKSNSSNSNSTTNSGSNTTLNGATLPTIPAPAKITGTLSGPGVTASTITIGQITTITGPVPGLFQGANDGLDAWANWINANGGLAGRQVKIQHVDDAFNCTTYTDAMKSFATSAFAVVGNLTLEDTCGKKVLAANPNMLDIQALELDPTLYSVPNVYAPAPNPPGAITTGLEYMKQKFPDAVTHAAQLSGQAAAANGKEERLVAQSLGYKYLYVDDIPDLTTNFTSYILRMKNQGVQFVDMTALAVTSDANFLQQAAQQNFHPKVLYGASSYDAQLFKLLGKASLANNVVWAAIPDAMYLGQDQSTVPAVNTFLLNLGKVRGGAASPNLFAVEAWSAGQLLAQAMQKAGSTVSQTAVQQAIGTISSFNSDGLIGTANPAQKMGTPCVVMANVQNGGWVRVDPSAPGQFDCSGSYHPIPLSQVTG